MPNLARIEKLYIDREATIENVVGSKAFNDLELGWLKDVLKPYLNYLQWLFGEARGRSE